MKNLVALLTVASLLVVIATYVDAQQGAPQQKKDGENNADPKGGIGGFDPAQLQKLLEQFGQGQFDPAQLQKMMEQFGKGGFGKGGNFDPAQLQQLMEQFGKGGIGKGVVPDQNKKDPADKTADLERRIDDIIKQLQELRKEIQPAKDAKEGKSTSGVSTKDPRAFQGYTLVSPMMSTKSFLIDMQGKIVHTWEGGSSPALTAYLLPNGNLLRPGSGATGLGGNRGGLFPKGRIQEFTWDGELVWDFAFQSHKEVGKFTYTHDLIKLPNGNVLAIMALEKTAAETAALGRKAGALSMESLLEFRPKGKNDAEIVWQWHVRDHLIQDHDAAKPNYGKVAEHPGRIDINFGGQTGMGGGLAALVAPGDWTHFNALSYNAELDQIMISVHGFSEFWIIDHSTTTAEAASNKGGKNGKGGDLLYRWGNPQAYRAGKAEDQQLFHQHNAHWIPKGLPGAGHVLVFNNGLNRKDGNYSAVNEIVLPVDAKGHYALKAGKAFGPDKAAWTYTAPNKTDFFAPIISGAQRLANGNTLICSGTSGNVFEVTAKNEVVWKFDVASLTGGQGALGGLAQKGGGNQVPGLGALGILSPGGMTYRAVRIGVNDPVLAGKKLTPAP